MAVTVGAFYIPDGPFTYSKNSDHDIQYTQSYDNVQYDSEMTHLMTCVPLLLQCGLSWAPVELSFSF